MITGDDATDVVDFNGPLTFAAGHGLTVFDMGTVSLPNTASDIATSGNGVVSITVLKNIVLASGSSITTVDGDVTLSANQQAAPAAGAFVGVSLNGATIFTAGAGSISLTGRGGTSRDENHGVAIQSGSSITSRATGTVTVQGNGGNGNDFNYGVVVSGAGEITSGGTGTVSVQGTGGNGRYANIGVELRDSG